MFYTFIWTFCPQLIEDGYVYAGVPPLYKVSINKDEYVYLKDEKALEEFKSSHSGKKYTITRMKGLGEMSAEETTILVDPNERIIHQVTVADAKAADKLFDDLMGSAVDPRRKYIEDHAEEANVEI